MVKISIHIQDPSKEDTLYLYEAIIDQLMAKSLVAWRGIFAFATGEAIKNLFIEDLAGARFIKKGQVKLVVGIDAVTDDVALRELYQLTKKYANFEAKIFDNPYSALFHPKISHFKHNNGTSVLIIGSGNLTSGGLRKNIEAFTIITGEDKELGFISDWDAFLKAHGEVIKVIDEAAIQKCRKNKAKVRRRPRERGVEIEEVEEAEAETATPEEKPEIENRALVAYVPKAGGRWHQIHYNKDIVREFFRAKADSSQRVFLREVIPIGSLGENEVRPLVYSKTNKNYKVEIGARRGSEYPRTGAPIIVLRETGLRSFHYVLLLPGDKGYSQMVQLMNRLPGMGKGVKRVLTNMAEVLKDWSGCPL